MNNEPIIIDVEQLNIKIPQCCQEGWDDCPHAVKKEREKPTNIAL